MPADVGDVIRAAVVWDLDGSDEQCNVHFLKITAASGTISDSDLAAGVQEYFEDLYTPVLGLMSSRVDHNRIDLYNVTDDSPLTGLPRLSTLDGSNSSNALPEGTSALVYLRTSAKRRIARKFLPTFGEDTQDGGELESAALTSCQSFASAWAANFATSSAFDVRAVVYDVAGGIARIPTVGIASGIMAYQRRRRRGRGS